jgi:hypothetical protein
MRFKRIAAVIVGIVFGSTVVGADGHRAGLFAAYSKASGSTLHGLHVAFDGTVKKAPEKFKFVTLMGDFSAHWGDPNGEDVTRVTYMGGFHSSHALAETGAGRQHVIGAHWLAGGVSGDGDASPVTAVGAAYDFVFRPERPGLVIRVQYDRVFRGGDPVGFDRISIGGVWRWPQTKTK